MCKCLTLQSARKFRSENDKLKKVFKLLDFERSKKTAKTKITYYNVRCEFSEQHQHEGFKKILKGYLRKIS